MSPVSHLGRNGRSNAPGRNHPGQVRRWDDACWIRGTKLVVLSRGFAWYRVPDAVEVSSENGKSVRLRTAGIADLVDADLEVVFGVERLVLLTRQLEEVR